MRICTDDDLALASPPATAAAKILGAGSMLGMGSGTLTCWMIGCGVDSWMAGVVGFVAAPVPLPLLLPLYATPASSQHGEGDKEKNAWV